MNKYYTENEMIEFNLALLKAIAYEAWREGSNHERNEIMDSIDKSCKLLEDLIVHTLNYQNGYLNTGISVTLDEKSKLLIKNFVESLKEN